MAARKYLDFRAAEFSLGNDIALWGKIEDVKNVFQDDLSTTDLMLFVEEFSPNQEIVYHDDEQRRAGSRSKRDTIKGRRNHGTVDATTYVRPGGPSGAQTNVPPQGATLFEGVFGESSQRIVDTGTKRTIVSVDYGNTDRSKTTFDLGVGEGAQYQSGDGIAFESVTKAVSERAHREVRFIDSVSTDTLVVKPGFSAYPDPTNDQIQGGVSYALKFNFTKTRTFLAKDGHLTRQLIGSAVEAMNVALDGVNPLKVTHTIGFREEKLCGSDQIYGKLTTDDSFASGDTRFYVGDTRVFEVGTYVNLTKIVVATGVETTETKIKITNVDHTNGYIDVERGATPQACTNLKADHTGSGAELFDTTSAYNLDIRLDYGEWVTIDIDDGLGHGAGRTASTIATNCNNQLRDRTEYGFNLRGGVNVNYLSVFSASGTNVKMESPLWGSQSRIEVRASATDSAHTLLFGGTVDAKATDEAQLNPWHPVISAAAETGKPIHNWAGWLYWDGYRLGVTNFEISLNNNVIWLEEEKADTDLPAGFIPSSTRTVEVTCEGYFYGEIPQLFYASKNDIVSNAVIQSGKTAGYTFACNLKNFKVANPEISGDEARMFSLTLRVYATSTLEDELAISFH